MLDRIFSIWYWFGSNRPGFFLGTTLLLTVMLLMYSGGIQASLSLGPGGEFPRFRGDHNIHLQFPENAYLADNPLVKSESSLRKSFVNNLFSPTQIWHFMLLVMTSWPPFSSTLLSCCYLDRVRSDDGAQLPSSPFPSCLWPYCLLYTPSSFVLEVARLVVSVVTQPLSWLCLQLSVAR